MGVAAREAGLEAGDIVLGPPGRPFSAPQQIREWTMLSPRGTPLPLRVLRPGDVMVTEANEMYGPHTAGPDGCTTVEIHGAKAGAGRAIYETEEGRRFVDYRPDDPMPDHPAWRHSRD